MFPAIDDPRVLGVVVTGSRGRDAYVRAESDWDLRVAVADGEEDFADEISTPHGSHVDVVATTIGSFGAWPEWDRYSFAHAQVLLDRTGGEFARIVATLGSLTEAEAHAIALRSFGSYTNSLYRALKNRSLGLDMAARLDAAEAVQALVRAAFALERRVQPFNKFLEWELENHPLREWDGRDLLARIDAALSGDTEPQQQLFRAVEEHARRHAFGEIIDSWGSDVGMLRGG